MSFFHTILKNHNLPKHDGRPLWKYILSDGHFERLAHELKFAEPLSIDPRDVALYYAGWWKNNYTGGKPSKQEIFNSIGGNIRFIFDEKEFFKLAKQGAQMLGVKWIAKQNTLYFRTLLLQGGLPLANISENQGKYQDFLLAVLDEMPDTIEDFMFKPHIINLLPASSQNDIIYENCLEIVKSILNKEDNYEDLFKANEALKNISTTLKVREKTLVRKQRLSKPQNYWLLRFKEEETSISLRIGFANIYDVDSMSNILGFEANGKEYQFYLNEKLICVFRKMLNGSFKSYWYQQQNEKWIGESNLPYAYVLEEGKKIIIKDFIQTVPNLQEPSLWAKYSDNEWRLIKGYGTPDKETAILFPKEWKCQQSHFEVSIYGQKLAWLTFEGEMEINFGSDKRTYYSEVNSFDWTIESQRPYWMQKTSMPVVQKKPSIIVWDENNKKLHQDKFKTWVKRHNSAETWQDLRRLSYLPLGCIDLKIEKEGVAAFDMFFNIGSLQINYLEKSIGKAQLSLKNFDSFDFKLDESSILNIENQANVFSLKVRTEYSKIPTGIKGSVGKSGQKKLYFEMASPFEGMTITDREGKIIEENDQLSLANLYGLRILSSPNKETILKIRNRLKPDVKITMPLNEASQPVISFKDEIVRLFYLADAMDYRNKVYLEIIEGRESKTYQISGFSYTLNVECQLENKLSLYNSEDELDLYAIPLNCSEDDIALLPLLKDGATYIIPNTQITSQFVVISSKENGKQLMPRFVNTDENYIGSDRDERINAYHTEIMENDFNSQIWKQLLAYFNICVKEDIPFSTFDQLRAISRSSQVASRAFLYLGIHQIEPEIFIQRYIPEMEKDLGFCFHWIKNKDWQDTLEEINELYPNNFTNIVSLISDYLQENNLLELFHFMNGSLKDVKKIYNADISDLRSQLGERVLNELPSLSPKITKDYSIPIQQHKLVKLLIKAPIAVAESITDTQIEYPIWAGDELLDSIRRNIQYCQYLKPEFYNKTILHALKNN
ncbi:hypothetical protein [Kriegella aquimaris]|uniref:Uncharacterized protein n=1 Tax=Kriegella aquimaris TaxID=192904 RepID=A0A1G9SM67_9FLAO|nr:hypothetical protein [Kriegella aquimaris]SDM35875.1 hypothetical protein SAMN04488514_1084 [Kriegella aquimaris]